MCTRRVRVAMELATWSDAEITERTGVKWISPSHTQSRPQASASSASSNASLNAATWSTPRRISSTKIPKCMPPPLALLEPDFRERCRPRLWVDQHQSGLLHAWPDTARPDVLEDRPEPHPFVERLLDLVQHRLPLLPIGLSGLLLVERVDVGIAAIGVGTVAGYHLRHPGSRVAVQPAAADTHAAELLRGPRREERRTLLLAHPELDPDGGKVPHDGLAPRKIGRRLMQVPGVEPVGIARLGQELLGLRGVVRIRLDGQGELEGARNDAARRLRGSQRLRFG